MWIVNMLLLFAYVYPRLTTALLAFIDYLTVAFMLFKMS